MENEDQSSDGQQEEQPDIDEQPTEDADDDEAGDEGEQDDDAGFDGPFDAKRARRAIDKARADRKQAAQRATDAEKSAKEMQRENLQLKVAMKLGVPASLASRLNGDDFDAMVEDASTLLDELGIGKPETQQPKPRLRGGARPNQDPDRSAKDIVSEALGQ
ncbi:hypothetical protein GCM10011490_24170 [Pseudoclavibacter endophyticus]|uniref:DUF4355 domain-containing protein n=1 Tax=Pseudoclavibacter endophyticus TaxID=1778590 RepID=A0A6H9WKX1_9MICO|nr:hypothetical protein [Pseudoclavibacter endophyticus]KAB1648419.1 hypothetical protein F8O04_12095 [Pseudoclavibacter endophyticus]GGA72562.1 hypothetical protein GCM10011490_24170 [Pseudoclavibacter endophyticus]